MPDLSYNSLQVIVYIGERMFSNPERPVSQSKNNDVFQSFRHFSPFLDIMGKSTKFCSLVLDCPTWRSIVLFL